MSPSEAVDVRTYIDDWHSHTSNGLLTRDGDNIILHVGGVEYTPKTLPANCDVIPVAGPLLLGWAARRRECKCAKKLS